MNTKALAHAALVLSWGQPTGALLTVRNASAETSVWAHYGPAASTVSGPAVYLEGAEVCSPSPGRVRGRVVVAGAWDGLSCGRSNAYRALRAAGALALVKVSLYDPPGFTCFAHDDWDPSLVGGAALTMVEAPGVGELAGMPFGELDGLEVALSAPHNRDYEAVYTSALWVLGLQVVVPLAGLWTGVVGWAEARRARAAMRADPVARSPRQELRACGVLICRVEGAWWASPARWGRSGPPTSPPPSTRCSSASSPGPPSGRARSP